MQDRRTFIKTAACSVGAIALGTNPIQAAGNYNDSALKESRINSGAGYSMEGFVATKLKTVRVAVIGIGGRGRAAVERLCQVPGVKVTALCELVEEKAQAARKWMKEKGYEDPKVFIGPDGYMRVCDSEICDVVHINTDKLFHTQVALYALNAGMHAMVEVPGCRTVEEGWALVEASEKNRKNCCLLANCCYGQDEMTLINMARLNVFDQLYHAEGCYLHETRCTYNGQMFLSETETTKSLAIVTEHTGSLYPIHALGPISLAFGINRGDQYDYLVSMGSKPYGWHEFALRKYGEDAPVSKIPIVVNDFNSTLINTKSGRTILIRQCNNSPMPYTRINTLYGFKGTISTNPLRISYEENIDTGANSWLDEQHLDMINTKYGHQLWKIAGEIAKNIGGHGGQDFLMDLRWVYCLRNGVPMDTNVYDLAAWSSIVELSEKSVRNRSLPVDIPDFTRGAWKTNAHIGEWYTDPAKI